MKSISEKNMWEWPGARWWRFDFHTHTPASYDFNEKNMTPNEWLLAFMREKVDCVAVTDHDSVEWIEKLKKELREMRKNPPDGFRELVLFPGVEITTSTACHILAIFSPETSQKDLTEFCGKLEYNKNEPERQSNLSDIEIVEKIYENHGLPIPAHLDDGASIASARPQRAKDILNHQSILAVEIKKDKWDQGNNLKKEVEKHCFVWGSDTHHLKKDNNSASYPGSRYAWVKMGRPTFEGLKLALMDKSVLHYTNKDPNEIAHPVIEKIEVNKAKFLGVKKTFSCDFNPWMNAIIGGRGTGKSTLIEFLRSALGQSIQNIENLYFSAGKDGLMTENTEITVYFRKDRMRYRSICQYNNKNNKTQIDTEYEKTPDTWESAGCVNEIFPIHIRSQKEILGLATNPKQLIKMVNDGLSDTYVQWDRKKKELEAEYIQLCKEVRKEKELIGKKESVLKKLNETDQKIELYKVSKDNPVINDYQACIREEQVINSWDSELTSLNDTIKGFSEFSVPQLGEEYLSEKIPQQEELRKSVADLTKKINVGLKKIEEGKQCITEAIGEWKNTWESHPENKRIQSVKGIYDDYKKRLGEDAEIIENTEMGNRLQRDQQELKKELKNIEEAETGLKALKAKCKEACSKIIKHRKKLCSFQGKYLNEVFKKNNLKVRIIPFGNKESVATDFRMMLKIDDDTFLSTIGYPGSPDKGLLSKLYDRNTKQDIDELNIGELGRVKKYILQLREGRQDEQWSESLNDSWRFQRKLQTTLKEDEAADRLRCWFPDDDLQIRFTERGYIPLSSGSPGQKSAVLLAFILSQGTEPLILDQPEDDLDNKMIYQMVVNQLREIKSSRQVIVVTHNANVVINGCAEYIVPLEIKEKETQRVNCGCMHEMHVQKEVCSILEGGTEALKRRYQRMIEIEEE